MISDGKPMMEREKLNLATPSTNVQYESLLEVVEAISLHRDLPSLLHDLAQRLRRVVRFKFLGLLLYDPVRDTVCVHVLETLQPVSVPCSNEELPAEEAPAGWVWQTQQPLWIPDVTSETRFPRIMEILRGHGVKSACWLPLTTAVRRVGALAFGSDQASAYGQSELQFMQQIAKQVAVAVDNALNYQNAQAYQQQLARERDRLRVLLDITNVLVSSLDPHELLKNISHCLQRVLPHDYATIALYDAEVHRLRLQALIFPQGKGVIHEELLIPVEGSPAGAAYTARKPLVFTRQDLQQFSPEVAQRLVAEDIQSMCSVPLITHNRVLGVLNVAHLQEKPFLPEDVDLLSQIAGQVAIAVENAVAYRQISELKDKLAEEKLYLEGVIRTEHNFEDIIGQSPALKRILKQVETVAPTDSTVMILGESGTGKELIARAIHNLSSRRERTFVKVNCAAIPTGLIESELFGHEKGAFTGAIAPRVGRFELAHKGTLFLDEVGDIPVELQPKLLRVLQEREFERLGSPRTVRVDVRLVTATNRDLAQMVSEGQFRNDLYYRLNVFPIEAPPLRERPEDIPLLVRYFAQKYAQRMNRRIETIPAETMQALTRWHWPGNIRELENFIERAVILSPSTVLRPPLAELKRAADRGRRQARTLAESERDQILQALQEARWVIGGPNGAAERLGLKRTTLTSKMRKLGITRQPS